MIMRFAFSGDIYVDDDKSTLDAFSDAPNFNRWMADTICPCMGKKVLEIGTGIGSLTRILVRGRHSYIASDLDFEHLERLKARLAHRPNLKTAHIDASCADQFRPFVGKVETVVCLNVLEHIEDDLGALNNIHSALEDGGRAVILVPEGQGAYGTLDEALGHFRRYSEIQLKLRMQEAGFEVERVIRFNRVSRPGWILNGTILKRRVISRFQLTNFDRFVWLWRRIDRMLPWSLTSIIAIGLKGPIHTMAQQTAPDEVGAQV